jgi:hypothetical protein
MSPRWGSSSYIIPKPRVFTLGFAVSSLRGLTILLKVQQGTMNVLLFTWLLNAYQYVSGRDTRSDKQIAKSPILSDERRRSDIKNMHATD